MTCTDWIGLGIFLCIPWHIVVYDRWVKKKMTYNWGGIYKECSDFQN
jgi:hypothetical protein